MKIVIRLLSLITALTAASFGYAEEGKDHPFFTRMPDYYIEEYSHTEFDRAELYDKNGDLFNVEGKRTRIGYRTDKENHPSPLQILKNYRGATEKLGGKPIWDGIAAEDNNESYGIEKNGIKAWVQVSTSDAGAYYILDIVEAQAFKQEVDVNAQTMANDIQTTGRVKL